MAGQIQALLGIHNDLVMKMYQTLFNRLGARIDDGLTLDDMLLHLNPRYPVKGCVSADPYDWIIMDVNLGEEGAHMYEQGQIIYSMVKPDVEIGKTRFVAMSGALIVEKATNAGIPTVLKPAREVMQMVMKPDNYQQFYDTFRKSG